MKKLVKYFLYFIPLCFLFQERVQCDDNVIDDDYIEETIEEVVEEKEDEPMEIIIPSISGRWGFWRIFYQLFSIALILVPFFVKKEESAWQKIISWAISLFGVLFFQSFLFKADIIVTRKAIGLPIQHFFTKCEYIYFPLSAIVGVSSFYSQHFLNVHVRFLCSDGSGIGVYPISDSNYSTKDVKELYDFFAWVVSERNACIYAPNSGTEEKIAD